MLRFRWKRPENAKSISDVLNSVPITEISVSLTHPITIVDNVSICIAITDPNSIESLIQKSLPIKLNFVPNIFHVRFFTSSSKDCLLKLTRAIIQQQSGARLLVRAILLVKVFHIPISNILIPTRVPIMIVMSLLSSLWASVAKSVTWRSLNLISESSRLVSVSFAFFQQKILIYRLTLPFGGSPDACSCTTAYFPTPIFVLEADANSNSFWRSWKIVNDSGSSNFRITRAVAASKLRSEENCHADASTCNFRQTTASELCRKLSLLSNKFPTEKFSAL